MRLQHRCFPVKIRKFLRIPFFYRTPPVAAFCEGTSLVKILQPCHFNIFGINQRCFRKMPIKKNNEKLRLLKRLSFLLLHLKSRSMMPCQKMVFGEKIYYSILRCFTLRYSKWYAMFLILRFETAIICFYASFPLYNYKKRYSLMTVSNNLIGFLFTANQSH